MRAEIACLAALLVSCTSAQNGAARRSVLTRQLGHTRATIVYTPSHYGWVTHARISIASDGIVLYRAAAPGFGRSESGFSLRDLDGDADPEVVIQTSSGGYFPGVAWYVYSYDATRNAYIAIRHSWSDGLGLPEIVDLDGDGRPELRSQDERFRGAFGAPGTAPRPPQVFAFTNGRFHDVTRRFPDSVEWQVRSIWRGWLRLRHRSDHAEVARYSLPTWAADGYLLRRGALVQARLQDERRHGFLADTDREAAKLIRG